MLSTGLHFASESTPSSFLALRRRFWHCVGVRLRSRVFLRFPVCGGALDSIAAAPETPGCV